MPTAGERFAALVAELKRRRVFRVAALYAATAFVVVQVAQAVFPALQVPSWTYSFVVVLALLGFPVALVLAWAVDVTPEGIRRTPPRATSLTTEPATAALSAAPAALATPPSSTLPSIVVLPFENLSPDAENEYFSDGLTEEITTDLSQLHGVRVISRTSARRLKGADNDVWSIARELCVRYVLQGAVRKAGDALRITVQLIDAEFDAHVWAEKYSGTTSDVFDIQESVARSVLEALRVELQPEEDRALSTRRISDPRAYESYLRARHEIWRFSGEALDRARQHLENALRVVGENALLYTTLGHVNLFYREAGIDLDDGRLQRADDCASRALALDPESPRARWLRGCVHFHYGHVVQAVEEFNRSRLRDPDDPDVLVMLGYADCLLGRTAEATPLFERAIEVDPLTPVNHCMPGFAAVLEGRFSDALGPYRRQYEMDPTSPFAHATYAWALAWNRRVEELDAVADRLAERFGGTVFASLGLALKYGMRGDRPRALAAITPDFVAAGAKTEMLARELSHCYALAGESERSLDSLERAVALGLKNYRFLSEFDRFLDPVRDEPRFQAILGRVKAEQDALTSTARQT